LRGIRQTLLNRQMRENQALGVPVSEAPRVGFAKLIAEQLVQQTRIDRRRGGCFVHDLQIRTNPTKSANTNLTQLNSYDTNIAGRSH